MKCKEVKWLGTGSDELKMLMVDVTRSGLWNATNLCHLEWTLGVWALGSQLTALVATPVYAASEAIARYGPSTLGESHELKSPVFLYNLPRVTSSKKQAKVGNESMSV